MFILEQDTCQNAHLPQDPTMITRKTGLSASSQRGGDGDDEGSYLGVPSHSLQSNPMAYHDASQRLGT